MTKMSVSSHGNEGSRAVQLAIFVLLSAALSLTLPAYQRGAMWVVQGVAAMPLDSPTEDY